MSKLLFSDRDDSQATAFYVNGYCGPKVAGNPRRVSIVVCDGVDFIEFNLSQRQALQLAAKIKEYYSGT